MSKSLRNTVIIFFTALFLLIAPVLVLYSAGYRYHPLKRRIEKTGIVRVETIPSGARVWLNGEPQDKTSPAAFSRLLPEDYEVRVEKEGYLPWIEDLEVRSGETTFAVGVRLIKDALPRLVTARTSNNAVWHEAAGRITFLQSGETLAQEILSRDERGNEMLLARFSPGTYADISLTLSPDGRSVLATAIKKNGETHLYALSSEEGRASSRSLHDAFLVGKLSAHWTRDNALAVTARDGVYSADTDGAATRVASGKSYVDAIADGRAWYAISTDSGTSTVMRVDGDTPVTLTTLPHSNWRFVDSSWPLIATDASRGRTALINGGPGVSPVLFDASRAQRSSDGRSILLWNDFEISVYDVPLGTKSTVTRIGATILEATRTTDGSIAFSTPSGIALMQPTKEGWRDAIDLVRFTDIGPFHLQADGSNLHFFGAVGNMRGLYEREL